MKLPMMYLMDFHPPACLGEAEDEEGGVHVRSCSNSNARQESVLTFSIF